MGQKKTWDNFSESQFDVETRTEHWDAIQDIKRDYPDGLSIVEWDRKMSTNLAYEYPAIYQKVLVYWDLPPTEIYRVWDTNDGYSLAGLEVVNSPRVRLMNGEDISETFWTGCRLGRWHVHHNMRNTYIYRSVSEGLTTSGIDITYFTVEQSNFNSMTYVRSTVNATFTYSKVNVMSLSESKLKNVALNQCSGALIIRGCEIDNLTIRQSNVTINLKDSLVRNLKIVRSKVDSFKAINCAEVREKNTKGLVLEETHMPSFGSPDHTWDGQPLLDYMAGRLAPNYRFKAQGG